MDLQEFVSESLTQIIKGIQKAQKDCKSTSAKINPKLRHTVVEHEKEKHGSWRADPEHVKGTGVLLDEHGQYTVSIVEFDIALTADRGTKTVREGSGLKLAVAGFEVGAEGRRGTERNESNSNVSRVIFKIPVKFPAPQL